MYKDLNEFLSKHIKKDTQNGSPTHTRIPDPKHNIYGGSYLIPKEELPEFYKHYYHHVFTQKKPEYLTERQMENGPLLVDVDFRYNHSVETRQHTKEHIIDLLNLLYLEELKQIYDFEPNKSFPIYVFEKKNVNRLADGSLTKDGIHMIIGIQMDHVLQTLLREKIVEKVGEIWPDLPIINTWDAVFDEGISKGTTNWQMFGSKKPNNEPYEWTHFFKVSYDARDGEFMFEEEKITEYARKEHYEKMMAQYADHVAFPIKPAMLPVYEARKSAKQQTSQTYKAKKENSKTKVKLLCDAVDEDEEEKPVQIQLEKIKNRAQLEEAAAKVLESLKPNEYAVKEAHQYTQILPARFYEPGSHAVNRQVAFALKHMDDRLFLSWVMLRSKAEDFDYGSIPELYLQWTKYFKDKPNGITVRSIMFWAKQYAPEDYEKVKMQTRDYYIDQTLTSWTEFDVALVLYHMFRDKYVCSNLQAKTWYVFKQHRWELDRGQSLRMAISVELFKAYQNKINTMMNEMHHYDGEDERYTALSKLVKKASELSLELKKTAPKNNIMREVESLFYDGDFDKNMDSNKWLLCFNNGVVDLKNRVFRDGSPQDYLTKSTNIPYTPIDPDNEKQAQTIQTIQSFMSQLFPDPELNEYMWEHLASTLIGENKNQTFNIYRGSGSNGKSILTDLMGKALGDYYGEVPITLVTEKRPGIGGTTSEIMQLKGVRYAVMQEPSKDARINEGMMKQLTGDSKLSGRALYHEQETFMIQFHLVVCTNSLFEVNSNDDGTWRRIRICDFMAKFMDEGADPLPNTPYQFVKDKSLKDKLDNWVEIFISLLVNRAFENQGIIKMCPVVEASSKKYRQGQDHISGFVTEMVGPRKDGFIKKTELCEQFKLWFQDQEGANRKMPKPTELYEYMDSKYGKSKRCKLGVGWSDVEILYVYDEEDDADLLNQL